MNPPANDGVSFTPSTPPFQVGEIVIYSCVTPNATLTPEVASNQCGPDGNWLFSSPVCFGKFV